MASLLTKILCLNCADLNETVVRKILEEKALNRRGSPLKPRKRGQRWLKGLHAPRAEDSGGTGEETRSNERALFTVRQDPEMQARKWTLGISTKRKAL